MTGTERRNGTHTQTRTVSDNNNNKKMFRDSAKPVNWLGKNYTGGNNNY